MFFIFFRFLITQKIKREKMQNLLPGKFGQAASSASDSMKQQHDPNSGYIFLIYRKCSNESHGLLFFNNSFVFRYGLLLESGLTLEHLRI